ncbi:dienelactone hydrolase family protein [Paenibacillus sp. IB182496]|uniref:Dienelactone hydrolase family protein n=1 Tax=Paenibacillus sabuli TaxID=2772509 RepID=A0A927BRD8_9BACL|nr:alpha/beta hydrolase family protein [Paenibacillus sabuli]MBD2844149.1 dienelactone hydrolase family protein [Paenibacillus sabuli]
MNEWKADTYMTRLYEDALLAHRGQAEAAGAQERRERLREALLASLGSFEPEPNNRPRVLERVDCGSYIRERVELSATPGLRFAAYVLLPKGAAAPLPGVVALHGHGYGSREIVGLLPDGTPDTAAPGIHQHFALQLVARGLTVIAPDVVGFGERRLEADTAADPDAPSSCFKLATQLMMLGRTLTGLRMHETLRAFEYLAARPEVDGERVGIMGFSGGALIAYTAAVRETRIRAAVLTGFPNTFRDSILRINHCIDNYTPGLLLHAELPELIGLIAPRPLFLESGADDPIFPRDGFARAAEQLRAIYDEAGAGERLQTDLFPGRHEISGRRAYDWLAQQLS